MKACMTCISTCSRPAILRCPSVAYFVPVSSLCGASFDRTIAARAIRSRFFEAPSCQYAYPVGYKRINIEVINDNFPQGTSWTLKDAATNTNLATGSSTGATLCVPANAYFMFRVNGHGTAPWAAAR